MRVRLYGSLAALALVALVAVLVTESTKGQCTVVCTWQVPLLVIGVGASCMFLVVAAWAIVYEIGRAAIRGRHW